MVNVPRMGMVARMVWVVAVVVLVVVCVNVQGVVAKKAAGSAPPAKKGGGSYGLPPTISSDCGGVAVPAGGATKLADPDDCTKYSLCLTSFGLKLNCPFGQHFSAADQLCTSPEKAGCDPAFAPTTPAAENAAAAAALDTADAEQETDANPESADQAEEEAASEVEDLTDGAAEVVEDVQKSAAADDDVNEA